MSFLERKDNEWLNVAVDPEMRAQRIVTLASNRLNLVWALAIGGFACAIAMIGQVSGGSSRGIGPGLVFLSVVWGFTDIQRELRLLKLVARIQPSQQLECEPLSSSVE